METKQYFVGVDLGKKQDHSVIAIIEKEKNGVLKLVFLKCFPLETEYAVVLGYLKCIQEKLQPIKILIDQTGVGEAFIEEAKRSGIKCDGVTLTLTKKQEILGFLKMKMQNNQLRIPYDPELIAELNNEKFELAKDGQIKFYHPEGSHDDRVWSLALAVYAAREEKLEVRAVEEWKW